MPQLDKFSFFTQIFWLIVLLFLFYLILINILLPNLAAILKIRYKKLFELKQSLLNYSKIEIDLYKFKKDNIINILLFSLTSTFHYTNMISKYTVRVNTLIKKYVKVRNKIDPTEKRKLYEIFKQLFSQR